MRYAIFASLAVPGDVPRHQRAAARQPDRHHRSRAGCFLWPQSVYGVVQVSQLAWVGDVWRAWRRGRAPGVLAIRKSQSDMLSAARKQATIDASRLALEREVAERQRTERLLSLQYVITRVLAGANSLSEAAPLILRIMGENQGWHVGELWEVDEGRQSPALRGHLARRRLPRTPTTWRSARTHRVAPDVGLAGRVWQRHLPLWIPDMAEEPTLPMAGLRRGVGPARRLRDPAAQRPRGDRRDGLLQHRGAAGQRRPPLDAERAGRPDRPVHGAQAHRAGPARQRGALPLGDRRPRRGDHPRRRGRAS